MKILKKTLLSVFFVISVLVSLVAVSNLSASAESVSFSTTNAAPTYIYGDVNLDGVITIQDATMVQMHLAGITELDSIQVKLADCDDNLGTQVTDVTWIQMYIAKIDASYPVNSQGYKVGDVVTFKAVLMNGKDFNNNAFKSASSVETVTFSKWWNYTNMFDWEDGIIVDEKEEGLIRAFTSDDKKTLYVLSEDKIYLNPDCSEMFSYNNSLVKINFYNTDATDVTSMSQMFCNCPKLKSIYTKGFNTINLESMAEMFRNCDSLTSISLPAFDTSKVTDMTAMFSGCENLKTVDLSNFDTSSLEDVSYMFIKCYNLATLDLSSFKTPKLKDTSHMFGEASALTNLNISGFNTSNVTDMSYMFSYCNSLKSLDLSHFNTLKATTMKGMFIGCSSLETLNLSGFKPQNVKDMQYMFANCTELSLVDLSNFNTANAQDMSYMFWNCSSLTSLNLSKFDTSKVTAMDSIFTYCFDLKTIYVSNKWTVKNIPASTSMFYYCENLVGGNGTKYNYYNDDVSYACVDTPSKKGYLTLI